MTRVLIVDDEVDVAEVIRLVLEDRGYEVKVAHNGLEAKKELEKSDGDAPELVISDLMMPHMTGSELVDWMRTQAKLESVPVLVMSAVPPTKPGGKWQAFLQKPFRLASLVSRIDELLGAA